MSRTPLDRRASISRPYAARVTSFTCVSLQERQATTDKSGSPPCLWTLRTSFMMSPQEGQRRIGRLSGKTMIANPVYPALPQFPSLRPIWL